MRTLRVIVILLLLSAVAVSTRPEVGSASTSDFWGFKVNGWQKYPNPVLPVRPGMWDSGRTREMSPVTRDSTGLLDRGPNGELTTYYFGSDLASQTDTFQIGRATSVDNGYTWTNRSIGLAPSGVAGSWYRTDVYSPSVLREVATGNLLLMAAGQNGDHSTTTIGAFRSTNNGSTWNDLGVQVTMSMFKKEDGSAITEFGVPRVIKRKTGDYLMVLEGQQVGTSRWRIFAATSPSFSGPWIALNGGKPILSPGAAAWEDVGVANPQIIEVAPSSYVLAYNGRGTGAPGCWQIGFASSEDLFTWHRSPTNPDLLT